MIQRTTMPLALLGAALLWAGAAGADRGDGQPGKLVKYDTKYYTIYSDLPIDGVREAAVRMTCMAQVYHEQTQDFAGQIRSRFPFYLFQRAEDYRRAGGIPGSAGVFRYRSARDQALMAIAGAKTSDRTWHVVQHEGFHQFVANVISLRVPIWLNEGLAEYFGQGIWTGDDLVVGVIPPGRLKRVKAMIRGENLLAFEKMLTMDGREWNAQLAIRNYDQGWSMLHFLVHGEEGKYRKPLVKYINAVARGADSYRSWVSIFGSNHEAFRQRYSDYWLNQPADPSAELRDEAVIQTVGSFFARAAVAKVEIDSAETLLEAMAEGRIQVEGARYPELWLPTSLGQRAVKRARELGRWELTPATGRRRPLLKLVRPDGAVVEVAYKSNGKRRPDILIKTLAVDQAAEAEPAEGESPEKPEKDRPATAAGEQPEAPARPADNDADTPTETGDDELPAADSTDANAAPEEPEESEDDDLADMDRWMKD
mgnify:FL=1